jgi:enoyl-CoA hydratase
MPITVEVEDRIATVTLENPPVNALTVADLRELTVTFAALGAGRDASVAVLRSSGSKVFCAGADFRDSERRYATGQVDRSESARETLDKGRVVRECFSAILHAEMPVVASVHGAALGSGLSLVAASDIVIASSDATFGLPEINVGVLGGGSYLHRMVGTHKTRHAYFTGRPITAHEMHRLGAVEQVVPAGALDDVVAALAHELAAKSPIALRLGKQSLNRSEALWVEDGYRVEQDYTLRLSGFEDSREARNAFREKRAPDWTWT